ncbi:MAG: hypothetical protein R6X05_00090 [Desulfobacterales bacterium]
MKNFKVFVWVLIFTLIGLVIYQNKHFFLEKPDLSLNLFFFQYQTSKLNNAIIFSGCFLLGILLSYFLSLSGRFRANKAIKNLRTTVDLQVQKISELTRQNEALKAASSAQPAQTATASPQG